MLNNSFIFDGVDARAEYGIIVEDIVRPLFAKLRERKVTAPFVSGSIDFGAKYRDDMLLKIVCGSTRIVTQAQAREVAYWLSSKSHIYLWDEPDKYYIGRIYDAGEIERMVGTMKKFTLSFVCDPCVYGQQKTEQFNKSANLQYAGTEETPTIITITNNNAYALNGLTITMKEAVKS